MTTIPPEARTLFETLCDGADDVDLDGLRLRLRAPQHLDEVRRATERDELLPIDVAETLAAALERLLKEASSMSPGDRALVVGAARYFCSEHDAVRDTASVLGLDDDVAIYNLAVRQLGRDDLVLDP